MSLRNNKLIFCHFCCYLNSNSNIIISFVPLFYFFCSFYFYLGMILPFESKKIHFLKFREIRNSFAKSSFIFCFVFKYELKLSNKSFFFSHQHFPA